MKINLLFRCFLFVFFPINLFAVNLINYYEDTVRIEVMDCSTYSKYKKFPSTYKWSFWNDNLANKTEYLFLDNIASGYYSIVAGSNVPKKLCISVHEINNKSHNFKVKVSSYQSCNINVISDSETGKISIDASYDCHGQELK